MISEQVTIIGTGAVGSLLAKALYENNVQIYSLFNRSPQPLQLLDKIVNPRYSATFPKTYDQLGDLIFITTPDHSIQKAANKLAELFDNFSNKIVAHCSGSQPSSALSSLQKKGAFTAAFHPVQTFTPQSNPSDFCGIFFDVEGDKTAVAYLKEVAGVLNADSFEISPKAKPYLHAAGVAASNYLVALLDTASEIAQMGGMERKKAVEVLMPLVQKSLDNIKRSEHLSEALSGPIARGDVETVSRHIKLLGTNNEIQQFYKLLGKRTLELAVRNKNYSAEKSNALAKLFEDE